MISQLDYDAHLARLDEFRRAADARNAALRDARRNRAAKTPPLARPRILWRRLVGRPEPVRPC